MAAFQIHYYSYGGNLLRTESGAPIALIKRGYKEMRAGRCSSFMVFSPDRQGATWHGRGKDLAMPAAELARYMRNWRKQLGVRWPQVHVSRPASIGWVSHLRGEERLAMERMSAAAHEERIRHVMESRIGTRRRRHGDSRMGTPVYGPRTYKRMMVLIENPDKGTEEYRWWRGSSAKAIRDAAKRAYPGCKLRFGKVSHHVR